MTTPVQYVTSYKAGDMVMAGTIVQYDSKLFFATQATDSNPDNASIWAEIGILGTDSQGFLGALFGATPKAKTPEDTQQQLPRNMPNPTKLGFDEQAGGRRRRHTVKKPRRK